MIWDSFSVDLEWFQPNRTDTHYGALLSKKKIIAPILAGVTATALVGGVAYGTAMATNDVALTIDGETTTVETRERTVADVLAAENVELGEHDVVLPAEDTKVTDEMDITVMVARLLEVSVDGETREVWTTGKTVQEALGFLDLDAPDSKLSASRSDAIGREGLTLDIITAKDVKLISSGAEEAKRFAGTVGELLTKEGIKPDSDDIVEPAAGTMLEDGMTVKFVDVEVKTSTKDIAIPFAKKTVESDKMAKGTSKVTTKGVEGSKRETWTTILHDGAVHSSTLAKEEIVKQPVAQVTTIGTYVEPEPEPEPVVESTPSKPASKPSAKETPKAKETTKAKEKKSEETKKAATKVEAPKKTSRSGGKYDWMRAAGIPESQWQYVDYIVSRESGWNPRAVNRSSGACGLVQALPCSKLGSNWSDPVHALKWQYSYVKSRYGGYAGAYSFWQRNHWY